MMVPLGLRSGGWPRLEAAGFEAARGARRAEISGKGGVHGVGTAVFTVSAQFGVPVALHMGLD